MTSSDTKTLDYHTAEKIAMMALRSAREHNTPPIPKAYRVWFEYAAGANAPLKQRINDIVQSSKPITGPMIERIAADCCTDPDDEVDQIAKRLDAELSDVVSLLQDSLSANTDFMGTLTHVDDKLSAETPTQELRKLVTLLVDKNKEFRERSQAVHGQITVTQQEISEMRRELDAARQDSFYDHLTEIPNRRYIDKFLGEEMSAAKATGNPLSLVLVDVDRFKAFNDTWGHQIGDVVLKQVARILVKGTKGRDIAGRFGGEEFAIILPETTLRNGMAVAANIRKTLEKSSFLIKSSNQRISDVTASFGVTQMRTDDTIEAFMKRADMLLYKAKESGRNRVMGAA
ncbi:MAG: GGDEF domain-containing protein [Pseudomonadota bacterium]